MSPLYEKVKALTGDYPPYGDCLNGIAYNQKADKLLMTGKRWPIVFEIELDF